MARATAALIIKVAANSYEFNRAMETVSKKVQNIGRDMQRVGKNMSLYFTAPMAAIAGASVKLYDTQARAEAKVEQAIKSTAGAARLSFEQLKSFASELQGKTIFGDEDILNKSTAQLLTFTNIAGENFKRAQTAALDLSTVLDGDLQSASMQLGKALNDPVRSLSALRKSGIQFSNEQETVIKKLAQTGQIAKAQSLMLDELERQYGGQAEKRAKEGAGALIQLKNKWGDFLEQIGKAIMPALNTLVSKLSGVVDWLSGLSNGTKTWIVTIGALVAALGPTLLIIGKLISMAPLLSKGFGGLTNTVTLTIAAIGLLIIALNKLHRAKQESIDRFAGQRRGEGIWTVENFDKAEADYEKQLATINNLKSRREEMQAQMKDLNVLQMGQAYTLGNQIGEIDKEIQANENLAASKYKLVEELRQQKKQTTETSAATDDLNTKLVKMGVDLDSLSETTPKATGLIAQLGAQIEKLETKKANANNIADIAGLNSQIESLRNQINNLNGVTSEYLALRAQMTNGLGIQIPPMVMPQIKAQDTMTNSVKINPVSKWITDTQEIKKSINDFAISVYSETENALKAVSLAEKLSNAINKLLVINPKLDFKDAASKIIKQYQKFASGLGDILTQSIKTAFVGLGETLGGIMAGDLGLSDLVSFFVSTIGKFLVEIGTYLIMTSEIMVGIKESISALFSNPWIAIAVGVGAIALGVLLQSVATKKIGSSVPKLAQGGLAYGPTYAMVGDNVGAKVDPEVIAPLSKLKGIIGGAAGSTNINLNISGKLTASGRDLALQLSNENYKLQVMGR